MAGSTARAAWLDAQRRNNPYNLLRGEEKGRSPKAGKGVMKAHRDIRVGDELVSVSFDKSNQLYLWINGSAQPVPENTNLESFINDLKSRGISYESYPAAEKPVEKKPEKRRSLKEGEAQEMNLLAEPAARQEAVYQEESISVDGVEYRAYVGRDGNYHVGGKVYKSKEEMLKALRAMSQRAKQSGALNRSLMN